MNCRASVGIGALLAGAALVTIGAATTRSALQRSEPVQIASAGGGCLEVYEPDQYNNGGRVQMWTCNGARHQVWFLEFGVIRSAAGKCLEGLPSDPSKSARVQIWDCNGSQQQRWSSKGAEIMDGFGRCLDVPAAARLKEGAIVQIRACTGADQQRWFLQPR